MAATHGAVRQDGSPLRVASSSDRSRPGWELLAVVTTIAVVLAKKGPITDADVFWHILVGQYTLHGHGFPHPDPFAYTLPGVHWHSTAWLSELGFAALYSVGGLKAFVWMTLALTLAIAGMLYRQLVRGSSGWVGPLVFTIVLVPLSTYIEQRPQTISLLFLIWLSQVCHRQLRTGDLPRFGPFLLTTYLWACLHGLFVLAPAALVLLAVGALVQGGRDGLRTARALTLRAAVATAVCAVTPMGPRLLISPLTVGHAAKGFISEWNPTDLTYSGAWGFAALLLLGTIAYAKSADVPSAELTFTLAVAVFGFLAVRNAGPASLLLAPLVADRMTQLWNPDGSTLHVPRAITPVVALVGLLAAGAGYATGPTLDSSVPASISATLARQPGTVRVLNDYNISGYLLLRASPHIKVDVDGRADRYGAAYLSRYQVESRGRDGWKQYVEDAHAAVAVLPKEAALTSLIEDELGWRVVQVDGDWDLLVAPGATLA